MEGVPDYRGEHDATFVHYVAAIKNLEEKYRRGEIRLDDLLYGYDRMQEKFYDVLNPTGPKYQDTWKAGVTYDGYHYTERLANDVESLTITQQREQDLTSLLQRTGNVLSRETVDRAFQKVRDPNLTDEEFRNICSGLLSQTFKILNGE